MSTGDTSSRDSKIVHDYLSGKEILWICLRYRVTTEEVLRIVQRARHAEDAPTAK